MIHIRHDIPGTPLKLYVPFDQSDPWRITATHADGARWIAKPDEVEIELSFPNLIAMVLEIVSRAESRMKPPPASVPSMDAPPSGLIPLFGEAVACPVIVGGETSNLIGEMIS